MLASPIYNDINSKSKIFFSGSPMNFEFKNLAQDATIQKVSVEIYVWGGIQSSSPDLPEIVFLNLKKTSPQDKYIEIEISSEINAMIVAANLNRNNPEFAYNLTSLPTTSGEGVYFHIVYKVDAEPALQLGTYFATTGYRLTEEKGFDGYSLYKNSETFREYAEGIRYYTSNIDLTTILDGSSVPLMLPKTELTNIPRKKQTGVKCLIAYINRLGIWDTFTPFGKVTEDLMAKSDFNNLAFRNQSKVNTSIQHLQSKKITDSNVKYTINTGLLDERNNYQIKDIIFSPKIYLIFFEDRKFTELDLTITVDSTTVTVDNTEILVSEDTVQANDIGFYNNFKQIPVKNVNNNLVLKTQLNEKSSISYSLEFETTNDYISFF